MAAQPPADTRMMGIVHAAFHRDLARLRVMLTAAPAPGGGRRKALAGQVLWLMEMLHTHHQGEDDGLWPLVRERDPAADGLLDEMVAEHHAIVPAIGPLTKAARRYESAGGDGSRVELVQALDSLTAVLVPHMDREVAEAMPVVARALTAADWHAWNQKYNVKPKSLRQLGLEGHWLLDETGPADHRFVTHQVPAVPRFIMLRGFARPYRHRTAAWWDPDAAPGRTAGDR